MALAGSLLTLRGLPLTLWSFGSGVQGLRGKNAVQNSCCATHKVFENGLGHLRRSSWLQDVERRFEAFRWTYEASNTPIESS